MPVGPPYPKPRAPYSRRDRPLRIYLAWPEHRKLSEEEFDSATADLGLFGEIICLDETGSSVDWKVGRGPNPEPVSDLATIRQSLSALRRRMAQDTDARVLIGGRREGFQGEFPGVLEEAMISLESHRPVYLVGGFGGVVADVLKALEVTDGSWLPDATASSPPVEGLTKGLDRLIELRRRPDWLGLRNGLSDDENRPSEPAASFRPRS